MVSTQARAALLSKRKRTIAKSHASVTGPFPLCHVLKSAVGCSPGSVAASPTAGQQIVVQRSLFCATRKARIVAKKSPRREKKRPTKRQASRGIGFVEGAKMFRR